MDKLSKTKLICYLAAIFIAGGVTGATVAARATKQLMAETPRTGHIEARYLKERFQSKLGLSAQQTKAIEPILDKMSEELKLVRSDCMKRIGALTKNSYEQISKELTPEQRVKLEEMKKDRPENSHRRFKPPPDSSRKSNWPPETFKTGKGD